MVAKTIEIKDCEIVTTPGVKLGIHTNERKLHYIINCEATENVILKNINVPANGYNLVEIGNDSNQAAAIDIDNVVSTGSLDNNGFCVYSMQDGCVINISNSKVLNAWQGEFCRLSNYLKNKNVTINISNCEGDGFTDSNLVWKKFILFQQTKRCGEPSSWTINVSNCKYCGEPVTAENVFVYYRDSDGQIVTDTSIFPRIVVDGVVVYEGSVASAE